MRAFAALGSRSIRIVLSAVCALISANGAVHAAALDYQGVWTITTSEPAPRSEPKEKPVASDLKALIGHTVTFWTDRIDAPAPLGCKKPHYAIKQYAADMLFQGGLTDPGKQASALGFVDKTIPTVETGCDGAIDFHFVNVGTALFALNNRVYRMERKPH
jgi:hypothetical protein